MTVKTNEQRAYARGYNSGAKWPNHLPPAPPNTLVAAVIAAGKTMRDWIDSQRAMGVYEEAEVGPMLDQFDASMEAIGRWIKDTA